MREELTVGLAQALDNEALVRLLTAVRSFADQAESLSIIMIDRGSDEASRMEVNELAASFWATEDRIEMALGLDRL